MNLLLAYIAKVIICSAVLYGYYYIALRNNRFHQWNRYYLVLITVISLLTPLLRIPLPIPQEEPSTMMSYTSRMITLRESVIPPANPAITTGTIMNALYTLVMALLLLRILVSIFNIRQLIRRSRVQKVPPYKFVENQEIQAPFSFFSYIFWDQHTSLHTTEGQQILKHELVHLQEKHSADKLFMEIITAIYWINPVFHIIKRELALVHEFMADKKAAGEEVAGYAQTILQMAFHSKQFSFTNDFFHPPIKRRILMLTQFHTPRFSYLRRILVLPVATGIFCSLAFVADKRPSAIRTLNTTVSEVAVMDTTPRKITPQKETASEPVFTFVEQPPVFKGGEDSLSSYLARNIKYPKEAVAKKISGIVFVQFVVDKKGNVTNAKTVGRDPGAGICQEALRVVNSMPRWVPGKQSGRAVAVQFNLPIRFSLNDGKSATDKQHVEFTPPPPPPPSPRPAEIFTSVEQLPTFRGGEAALAKYLSSNIKYPRDAQEHGISGTVFVQFIVMDDGNLRDIHIVGAPKGGGLDEEAIRVVKAMPKWNPGIQNKHAVNTEFNLPIRFTLQE
ncbi:outer membrane transport energization protein TonB [Chitinophaga polysaccharea]|uniref:Outer membrane transport energization protein TonB n=1 Tax=Chitinophaga polysaccharea TaxID=1293035 RepID=A0A561PG94_9BACT|nr:M56 family metallopeptidase [Chitinophaga polysaccharea]TWF37132.1 outer membrane transport energization protein TonB [Chitinophaga polysaccharea]